MLVAVLTISVTKIQYLFTIASGTNIQKISPTSLSPWFYNITYVSFSIQAFLCYRSQYLMRPKNYYEAPVGPKESDDIHDPSLKVKSINTRIDIIREAIQASIIQGTQEPLMH